MTTHHDRQFAALLAAATEHYAGMLDLIQAYGAGIIHLRQSSDLLDVMRRTAATILNLESLEAAAKRDGKALRETLAAAISESGATGVETQTHIATVREATRTAMITDAALIPPHLMTTPEPRPNRNAIRAAMEQGPVPGAAWGNGGPPVLVLSAKKGKRT